MYRGNIYLKLLDFPAPKVRIIILIHLNIPLLF